VLSFSILSVVMGQIGKRPKNNDLKCTISILQSALVKIHENDKQC